MLREALGGSKNPLKKRKREKENGRHCSSEEADYQELLPMFPKELCDLVSQSLRLPYEYAWTERGEWFTLSENKKVATFATRSATSVVALPSFTWPSVAGPRPNQYVADWVIRPFGKLTPYWAGITGTHMNKEYWDVETTSSLVFRISVGHLDVCIEEWPANDDRNMVALTVTAKSFAANGLQFSMDYKNQVLRLSVGLAVRLIPFSSVVRSWKECAPFASGYTDDSALIETVAPDRSMFRDELTYEKRQ